jgi:membrane protein implicated in regulation of membrane protease activity
MSGLPIEPDWLWLIGGIILLCAELIAPGFFLIFIGAAAVLTGIVALLIGIPVAAQLALFAVLAFVSVRVGGRRAYASRYDYSSDPLLNDRAARLLGQVVVVSQAVDRNGGRVKVGDGEWSARGGPAAVGERVRIVDIEGNCLKVQPEHSLPPPPSETPA